MFSVGPVVLSWAAIAVVRMVGRGEGRWGLGSRDSGDPSFCLTLLRSTAESLSLTTERVVVRMTLLVRSIASHGKAAISGKEDRTKMHGKEVKILARKAVGERWVADEMSRPPDQCDT